jgi:hypothetical protein
MANKEFVIVEEQSDGSFKEKKVSLPVAYASGLLSVTNAATTILEITFPANTLVDGSIGILEVFPLYASGGSPAWTQTIGFVGDAYSLHSLPATVHHLGFAIDGTNGVSFYKDSTGETDFETTALTLSAPITWKYDFNSDFTGKIAYTFRLTPPA